MAATQWGSLEERAGGEGESKRLGLTAEAERLTHWVMLCAKLGVTEARESDPAADAVEAWHEAHGELTIHVYAE